MGRLMDAAEIARRASVDAAIRKAEFRGACLTWQELSDLIADRRSLLDELEQARKALEKAHEEIGNCQLDLQSFGHRARLTHALLQECLPFVRKPAAGGKIVMDLRTRIDAELRKP